jgi:hypothetical protein
VGLATSLCPSAGRYPDAHGISITPLQPVFVPNTT